MICYSEAWDEISAAVRETKVFNFDKKGLVAGIFERLRKGEAS